MPELIEHIDSIARQQQRTVLYLEFHPVDRAGMRSYRCELDPLRERILAWCDVNGIAWRPCGGFANENVMQGWRGQVYLEVPYDEGAPAYQSLRDYLEFPDGRIRHPGLRFLIMPLETAQRNAKHDEPGYLENMWADRFSL